MKNLNQYSTHTNPSLKILVAVLLIALPFAGFVIGLYVPRNEVKAPASDGGNVSSAQYNSTTTTTPVVSTSVVATTTPAQISYTLTIGNDMHFDKTELIMPSGSTLTIKNNSGDSIGGPNDGVILTVDKSTENSPKIVTDTNVGQVQNGSSYNMTYPTPSGGTRLIKVEGACRSGDYCLISQAKITLVAP